MSALNSMLDRSPSLSRTAKMSARAIENSLWLSCELKIIERLCHVRNSTLDVLHHSSKVIAVETRPVPGESSVGWQANGVEKVRFGGIEHNANVRKFPGNNIV